MGIWRPGDEEAGLCRDGQPLIESKTDDGYGIEEL
jgi:hypothetical protein